MRWDDNTDSKMLGEIFRIVQCHAKAKVGVYRNATQYIMDHLIIIYDIGMLYLTDYFLSSAKVRQA